LQLAELVDSADVIAIGRVVDISDVAVTSIETANGHVFARRGIGTMMVAQYLKGAASGEVLQFAFLLPDEPMGYPPGVEKNAYRMLFLRRAGDAFEVANPFYPSLVARPMAAMPSNSGLVGVLSVLRAVMLDEGASTDVRVEAVNALKTVNAPLSQDSLQAGLAVADSAVRLRSAAALLMLGNLRGLPLVEAALLSRNRPSYEVALTLRGAIMLGTKDVAAIPAFTRLLGATDVETRRAASFALSRMPSQAAAAALIARFNDSDFEVRYNAVRGVARGLGETDDIPSEEDFRIDESRYVEPLRSRFAQQGPQ
jgi:hypothetical protein